MLLQLFSGGDLRQALLSVLLVIPSIILALSFHEAAHGYAAYKLGDRTAFNLGRLTLNPIKHLDPIGSVCMLVFGFGWAKPVPVNPRNFRNPKNGMAITALAGPATNLVLGAVSSILVVVTRVLIYRHHQSASAVSSGLNLGDALSVLYLFFYYFGYVNILSAVFNMLPIPPFDGSRIYSVFLPPKLYFKLMRYERQIMIGILVALFFCSYVLNFSPISLATSSIYNLLIGGATALVNLIL